MTLDIDDPETVAAVEQLATLQGVTPAQAIKEAVTQALTSGAQTSDLASRRSRIEAVVAEVARLPILDSRPTADIASDLYDENGLPH